MQACIQRSFGVWAWRLAKRSGSKPGEVRSSFWQGPIAPWQEGMIFIPFCYAEAAANILTNPQLDPFGKIPEFKFCAAKVEKAGEVVAAE